MGGLCVMMIGFVIVMMTWHVLKIIDRRKKRSKGVEIYRPSTHKAEEIYKSSPHTVDNMYLNV